MLYGKVQVRFPDGRLAWLDPKLAASTYTAEAGGTIVQPPPVMPAPQFDEIAAPKRERKAKAVKEAQPQTQNEENGDRSE